MVLLYLSFNQVLESTSGRVHDHVTGSYTTPTEKLRSPPLFGPGIPTGHTGWAPRWPAPGNGTVPFPLAAFLLQDCPGAASAGAAAGQQRAHTGRIQGTLRASGPWAFSSSLCSTLSGSPSFNKSYCPEERENIIYQHVI